MKRLFKIFDSLSISERENILYSTKYFITNFPQKSL